MSNPSPNSADAVPRGGPACETPPIYVSTCRLYSTPTGLVPRAARCLGNRRGSVNELCYVQRRRVLLRAEEVEPINAVTSRDFLLRLG